MTSSPFSNDTPGDRAASMAAHPSALPARGEDRVITGAQHRAARAWAADHTSYLAAWTCEERVVATVATLISDAQGRYDRDDLTAALREVDTVDVALDLLTDVGVPCGD